MVAQIASVLPASASAAIDTHRLQQRRHHQQRHHHRGGEQPGQQHRQQHRAGVFAQHGLQRQSGGQRAMRLQFGEHRGFVQPAPQQHRQQAERAAEHERQAPAQATAPRRTRR